MIECALGTFESKHHCLENTLWGITIIDRPDDDLFFNFRRHAGPERKGILFISEKCETVPLGVVVCTPEDTFERTTELLNQMFGKQ
jgi:hypothetical protein